MRTRAVFEQVTARILRAMEEGAGEYVMPWHRWAQGTGTPVNAATGRPYRGANILLLWAAAEVAGHSSGRWATYRQWSAAGAQVRKGEKATAIILWKQVSETAAGDDTGGTGREARFVARTFHVFNADQVVGCSLPELSPVLNPADRIASAERFFSSCAAKVVHGGDHACYMPALDEIRMPHFGQFTGATAYYSVLGHEHIHWTGARHRTDRNLGRRFGSAAYAMEELVAELGAAFLCAHLGLAVEPRPDHAAYLASWLGVLRNDPGAILAASAKAQEATDFLISIGQRPLAPVTPESADFEQLAA